VLEIVEREDLVSRARHMGERLREALSPLQTHPHVAELRGLGLLQAVELVRDRATLEPATAEAGDIVNLMREAGVLLSTDGPFDNVIKIKPPMVFGAREADILADELDRALRGPSPRA